MRGRNDTRADIMVGGAFRTPAVAVSGTPVPSPGLLSVMRTAAPQWGRGAATFREDGRGANSGYRHWPRNLRLLFRGIVPDKAQV